MPLTEAQLNADLTAAMKARDMARVYVLRGVIAAAKNLKVERRGAELAEADLVQVVRREIRKREEAEEFAVKAGRSEIIAQNQAERRLLEAYAPALLGPDDVERLVREIAASAPARTMGAVMATLREQHAGRYDGKQASEIVRRVLAETPGS